MRARLTILLLLCIGMGGCGERDNRAASAPTQSMEAMRADGGADKRARFMAYEHSVGLDVEEDQVADMHETARKACVDAIAEQCTILQSSLETGRNAHAELRMRMSRAGIEKVVAALGAKGEIVRRSVNADDLSAPIMDTEKDLARLKDYRERLESLRGRAGSDIESLIKVNQELAQVQSSIESMTGEHAKLMQRVDTEILNVSISSVNERSFWGPVGQALSDFGANFSQGISSAITGLAFLLPWSLVVALFGWILRKLWRRWRRPEA